MRFVPVKSEQQQSILMLHRGRQLLVRQRTMLSNAIRGHMAELGLISAKGRNGTAELLATITNAEDNQLPETARFALVILARQYEAVAMEIGAYRQAHPCCASLIGREPAAGGDSRYWSDRRDRPGCRDQ